MRQYKTESVIYNRRWGRHQLVTNINKGLKEVHIGDGVWLFGKQSSNPIDHMVIYAPDRKTEHHVFGETVKMLCRVKDLEYGGYSTINVNRHGNQAEEGNVKIYILTSILDDRRNWCFDLTKIPKNGELKVIYHNGTVKNIQFDGAFCPQIKHKYANSTYQSGYMYMQPVGYRIK